MKVVSSKMPATARYFLVPAILSLILPCVASADPWSLGDWDVNINGADFNYSGSPGLPSSVNASAFNFTTGLGSLVYTFGTAGAQTAGIYLYLFEDAGFGDLSNSYGSVINSSSAGLGLTYELGWPGTAYGTNSVWGNMMADSLDGSNHVPAYAPPPNACCSVALAMDQDFTVLPNYTDTVTFGVSTSLPTSGAFYLAVTNHDTGDVAYVTESLVATPNGGPTVPEPSAIILLLTASTGAFFLTRRRRA